MHGLNRGDRSSHEQVEDDVTRRSEPVLKFMN
jgi:hypothetical protein